jgi:hypothetical protein
MHQMREFPWSQAEKKIARKAFDKAYRKECESILAKAKKMMVDMSEPGEIWKIHDYLSGRRRQIDEKYDYRYSVMPLVLGRLIREHWIQEADVQGLSEEKLIPIKFLISEDSE